jgi:hypothetical protein
MGFNEELYTMALKPITGNTISEQKSIDELGGSSKDVIGSEELISTNNPKPDKMTTKTKKIVLASVIGLALGTIIFIIIKNRK